MHWEECLTPANQVAREPIDPMNNLWLNEDPYLQQQSSHIPADNTKQTTCGKAGDDQIVSDNYIKLTITLLEAVEKLTDMVLGERSNAASIIDAPQPSLKAPSTSSPKQCEVAWQTVPGRRKPVAKSARSAIECRNLYEALNTIPIEDRTVIDGEPTTAEVPANTWANSPPAHLKKHRSRPQIIINDKPDANNAIQQKTIPGNNSFAGAVKHGKKVALFSDSICNRMSKQQLRAKLNCNVNKKSFPGATTDDLYEHHMLPTLIKNTPDTAIIHIGVNDILTKGTTDGGLTSNLVTEIANDIMKCGKVCQSYGVNNICISSVLPFKGRRAQLTVNHINEHLAKLCREMSFDFLLNDNIKYDNNTRDKSSLFYSDGLHLNDNGRDVLIENFSNYVH